METRGESFSEVPPARTTTWKSISGEIAAVEGVAGPLDRGPLDDASRLTASASASASVRGGNRGGEDAAAMEDSKTESCAVAVWQAAVAAPLRCPMGWEYRTGRLWRLKVAIAKLGLFLTVVPGFPIVQRTGPFGLRCITE